MPVLKVLIQMERNGVHIDVRELEILQDELVARLGTIENEIFEKVGFVFKITSPKQLGEVLFEKLEIHKVLNYTGKLEKTTLGYKTDAKVLDQFSEHPVVELVQEHRELSKLLSTYVVTLPTLLKPSTKRIHTHFNQIGTATGRLSSSDPNLQNIPIRTQLGQRVRKVFKASQKDTVLVSADYSQIELRVLAQLSQDQHMREAFAKGEDIHRKTASQILGKSPEDISSLERSHAKAINFGIIYGMGATRLAKEQKISLSDAKKFIERYFENFSSIKAYLDSKRQEGHQTAQVKTYFGRIRPLPGMLSGSSNDVRFAENMAINSPIQGTAADIMKFGMIRVFEALKSKKLQSKILLQVHDELVLEAPISEVPELTQILKESMEKAVPCWNLPWDIPLTIDVSSHENWLEAK